MSAAALSKNQWGFTPQNITGLQLWFDGTDPLGTGTPPSNGAAVSVWKDKSGNGNNGTAPSTNATYSSTTNGLVFTGTQSYATPLQSLITKQSGFAVVSYNNSTLGTDIISVNPTSGQAGLQQIVVGSTNTLRVTTYGGTIIVSGGTFIQNTKFLYNYSFDSTGSAFIYYNGTQLGSSTGPYTYTGGGVINIGGYSGANEGFVGTMFELLLFNSVLTTSQRQQVEGYLAAKWGLQSSLPATHPYSTGPVKSYSGLRAWLDGADPAGTGVGPALGSTVTSWVDKSGNANNATSAGSAVTTVSAGLSFGGSSYFTVAGLAGSIANTPFVIFVVETLAGTASNYLFGEDSSAHSTTDQALHIGYRSQTDLTMAFYGDDVEDTAVSGSGSRRILVFYLPTASNRNIRRNGSVDVTHTNFTRLGQFTNPVIGRVFAGNYYSGAISEIIVYNQDIGLPAIQLIEKYLATKWNVTLTSTGDISQLTKPVYARPFQPVDIPGCQLWLDGADQSSMTFSSGTTVSVWKDKSGNGYNATILSGYTGATYSSASNCLYFPVYTTGYGTSYSANPTNETMFVVFNNPSPSANNNMVIGGPKGARSLAGGYSGTTGVGACSYLDNEVTWSGIASMPASTYASGSTVIITGTVSNSSSSTISQNGGTTYSNSGTTFNYAVVNTYIGTDTFYTPPSFYYIGYIMEIIFFNSVLSTSQRQQVESYLAWKWGLRINLLSTHPGYTLPSYSAVFNPKSIAGCYLWLDAADPTTFTFSSGTNVSTWADKSGQRNSPTSSSGTYPTYSSSLNAVQWTGGAQQLTFPSTIANAVVNSSFTVFFVSQRTSGTENFIIRGTSQATNLNLLIGYEPTTWRFAFYANDLDTTNPSYVSGESPTLSCFMYSTAASYKYSFLSGSIAASGSQSSSALTGWAGAMIGGNNIWPGLYANVYEVLIYNSALSTSQRQQVEGYLAWKWGLQGSLPSAHAFAKISP